MTPAPETIGDRLSSYERWQKYCTYFGAGLAGLVVIADFASEAFDTWPWSKPVFITLIVISAVCLGRSYIEYVSVSHRLQVYKDDHKSSGSDKVPSGKTFEYPDTALNWCRVGLLLGGLAALLVIVGAWVAPSQDSSDSGTSTTVTQTTTSTVTATETLSVPTTIAVTVTTGP